MRVDLHTHTAEHSACSTTPAVEMLLAARDCGLKGVVITDHHCHLAEAERHELQRAVPGVRVFRGAEIGIRNPELPGVNWEDLVIVGDTPCGHLDPLPADEVETLARFVRETGALTVLAHPFRYHDGLVFDLPRFTPDAVEIASGNVGLTEHDAIAALAREHGTRLVGASDAHGPTTAGLFYVELDHAVRTERELADAVRAGSFTIGGSPDAIRLRQEGIQPMETAARQVLAEGGDEKQFLAKTDGHAAVYRAVARGQSRLPNHRALGLRNDR